MQNNLSGGLLAKCFLELRKTGSYSLTIPKSLPEALRAYANEVELHNATKAIVAQQEQQIAEFKPVKDT